jgi:excinuclease UvrABC nuclease subunit
MATLRREDVPLAAGVYALYRSGKPIYVGKAKSLPGRVS